MLLAFNKPYGVLTQFTDREGRPTLASYISATDVYPAGRLDLDSEGLLLLTDDGTLAQRITHPRHTLGKTYLVQVEGIISDEALLALRSGLVLNDGPCAPAKANRVPEPEWLWSRTPPIRIRQNIPTSWLELTIHEGRNRQIRRMTAHVGLPTLRLIRIAIGNLRLDGLRPGETRELDEIALNPPPGGSRARRKRSRRG